MTLHHLSNLPFNPKDCTAVPPGTCLTHGYHGGAQCPQCSSVASVDPFRSPRPAVTPAQSGWVCPKCSTVYAPYVPECHRCAAPKRVTC